MRSFAPCLILVLLSLAPIAVAEDSLRWADEWSFSRSGGVSRWFEIQGTGGRNNPLRRQIQSPSNGEPLFLQFRLRYDASSIDTPENGNGEFFILWLDEQDGGDGAVHNGGVPNIGVHVAGGHNKFMARYSSSAQKFAEIPLQGDRVYTLLVRVSRDGDGPDYGKTSVWIDPKVTDLANPDIEVTSNKAPEAINWIGFATGVKTEVGDRISVAEVTIATSWLEAFGLPAPTELEIQPVPATVESITSTVHFKEDVLPLLRNRCFGCHAGKDPDSGLRLDSYDEVLNQVSPRDAGASHLVSLVESNDPEQQMPPADDQGGRLNDGEIAVLRTWIDEGVAWDHQLLPTPNLQTDHWAFQPVHRPGVPDVALPDWPRTPVDSFIARNQQRLGIKPNEPASWSTLQRRIALDLTGLPPSAFPGLEQATSHEQLDQWVDRLLESPEYAERWGRFWLDLARWAESNGHQHNRLRPHAWRYRDYVIQSFQSDKPFDQFIREQIAGDELIGDQQNLEATGFLAAARYSGNELDKEIQRNDILVDVVNTTANTFLGVTLECAQCHTHKFDPFTIRDYYRFQAFFSNGQPVNLVLSGNDPKVSTLIDVRWGIVDSVHNRLVERKRNAGVPEPILVTPTSVLGGMNAREREVFRDVESAIAGLDQVWGWSGAGSNTLVAPHQMRWPLRWNRQSIANLKTYLRLRGDVKAAGPEVQPGWPGVFGPTPVEVRSRTDLANWIASPENPLTARVWANRIWQWHFGRGLVESSGDFGTQGASPTAPELLDWLASELVDNGWSTRHLHRLIVNSSTYRQSAELAAEKHELDPDCLSLWRWTPRRLESEAIRDSVLSVSGKLTKEFGGPSVAKQDFQSSLRRSIYLRQQRAHIAESLTLFDSPPALASCTRRPVSTVALQPLYLLNSEFMQSMSRAMAERVRSVSEQGEQAAMVIRIALGRDATADEVTKMTDYLREHSLESLSLAVLNLSEFLYVN